MRSGVVCALMAGALALNGCSARGTSRPEAIRTLKFSYNISSDDIDTSKKRLKLLHAYLEKTLGMKVDMVVGTAYSSTVEAMRAGRIDAGTMGPMAYLLASQEAGAEAIAIPGTKSGGPGTYESAIVVRRDSPVRTLEELLENAEKYTFSFVDPASTSGHLIPRALLEGRNFDAEKRFRKVHFANDHLTSAYTVLGGKVDAGALMPNVVRMLEAKGRIQRGDLRFLWISDKIPQSPVAVRKDLPVELKERLRKAFVDLADTDPTLAREMQVTTHYQDYCFYPATDATYDDLRKIARRQVRLRLVK